MKKTILICFSLLCLLVTSSATIISGTVKDVKGERLSFASVMVKGSGTGTTANSEGYFTLNLPKGQYTLLCMHVGYAASEKAVTIGDEPEEITFVLQVQELTLKEIVVGNQQEDPAYEIIREAIKKRPYYKNQVSAFECQVYLKGQLRLKSYPKTLFGQKIDLDGEDSSQNKMIYLSETIATYSFQKPDKEKVVVTSTRVSGQTEGFGFGSPQFATFYDNNIQISEALNPRGFVSPIADNALSFYRYKFEGSFIENDRIIDRIKVIPRRQYEPVFSGYINIVDGEWRIHSVDLLLTKQSQMELADSLKIEHLYVPVTKDVWMLRSQVVYPSIKIFGFDANGSFVSVYSDYKVNPVFDKKYFNNIILKYDTGSNKKTRSFWDEVRPVPLLQDEIADYHRKDSLEIIRQNPAYLDSLDRKRNKLTAGGLLLFGQTFFRQSKKSSFSYQPLIEAVNFNTVEGFNVNLSPTYNRRLATNRSFSLTPTFRYGFSNKHFNADLAARYRFGGRSANVIGLSGGSKVFQINNENPVRPIVNTYHTLFFGDNFLKIYQAKYAELFFARGLGEGLTVVANLQYQDRMPLENTDDRFWGKSKYQSRRTPNYPVEISSQNFDPHQALIAALTLHYRPGTQYIEMPDRKINVGSTYPLFSFSYTKGLNGVLGSDVDFDRWKFSVKDDVNLKLWGLFAYNASIGGFANATKVELPDYQHFNGNRMLVATEYLNSFQLAPYYARSTTAKLYATLNVEHHFNGFLTNKIPLVKKLNIRLVAGSNAFVVNKNNYYYEVFGGIENVLKIFRFDYVFAYGSGSYKTSALRIGIRTFN